MIPFALLILGCVRMSPLPPALSASMAPGSGGSAEDAAPPAGAIEMHKALSARDGALPCETVEALSPEPVPALLFIVEHAEQPPWAAIRAAACLASRHAEAVQPHLLRWVSSPETRGLGIVTLNLLDQMPAPVASAVAQGALQGPLAQDARARLLLAQSADLRALAQEAGPTP